jgi:glycerate kinase
MPDSFKGSLTQFEFIEIAREVIFGKNPQAQLTVIPMADGGEGTVDCFLASLSGEKRELEVTFSNFEKRTAYWGDFGDFAVMEAASACGLAQTRIKNPTITTTFGMGEIIADIIKHGINHIIIGLGGSSTNDMGAGMAAALGVKFYKKDGSVFVPTGGTLSEVASMDCSAAKALLKGVKVTAMCDVTNPLYGEEGAAHIYSRQKGASEMEVLLLDANLRYMASLIEDGERIAATPGAGAAGGLGAGVPAFLGGELKSGIDLLLDLTGFDNYAPGADYIITGEGKLDSQSAHGKVISGIGARAKAYGKKIIVFCGRNDLTQKEAEDLNIEEIVEITPRGIEINTALEGAKKYLKLALESFFNLHQI